MYECIYRPCFFNLCECCLSCYFLHFRPRQFPLAQLKHTSECQMFYEFALAYIYILCNKFFIFLTGEVEIYTSVSIKYSYILYNIESIRYFQLILSLHSGTNIIFFLYYAGVLKLQLWMKPFILYTGQKILSVSKLTNVSILVH